MICCDEDISFGEGETGLYTFPTGPSLSLSSISGIFSDRENFPATLGFPQCLSHPRSMLYQGFIRVVFM